MPKDIIQFNRVPMGNCASSLSSDIVFGNLYHFDLNDDRTGLILDGVLRDKIADNQEQLQDITFGTGFHGVTDMQVGPDG